MPKVLCKGCSYPVGPTMARCPRCGRGLPYFTSKRRRRDGGGPVFARGKDCPVCGKRTRRAHAPLYLRPLRVLLPSRFSYRTCEHCGWAGGCFHEPSRGRHRHGSGTGGSHQPAPEPPGD